jgi:hypothetical protein
MDASSLPATSEGVREMAEAAIEAGQRHVHLCQGCAHLWWHSGSDGERLAIHRCPKCDSGPYYFGYATRRDVEQDRQHILKALEPHPTGSGEQE